MAMECVCFPVVGPRMMVAQKQGAPLDRHCRDPKQLAAKDPLDVCKIVERTREHERTKHDDQECHYKGEKRQNLINKLKMFLDDCDDRPVLKRPGGGGANAIGVGQTGYGPLIKYPGYVDYDHPYFSHPYDKMPELANTVGQRAGVNPCPPVSVRNLDAKQAGALSGPVGQSASPAGQGRGQGGEAEGCCRCAERRSVPPKCPAACQTSSAATRPRLAQVPSGRSQQSFGKPHATGGYFWECNYDAPRGQPTTGALPAGGIRYYCCPLPED